MISKNSGKMKILGVSTDLVVHDNDYTKHSWSVDCPMSLKKQVFDCDHTPVISSEGPCIPRD